MKEATVEVLDFKKNIEKDMEEQHLKQIKQLEAIAFHLTRLSKIFAQDREHWAETGKDLSKAVNNLNETLERFAELEKKVAQQVTSVMVRESKEAAVTITNVVGEKTEQILTKQIKEVVDHLSIVVLGATSTLTDYKWQVEYLKKWFLFGIVISSLVGNILAGTAVYYVLGNMQDRNAIEIIKEIRAIKRENKTPVSIPKNRNK